jgi:hypothetical protein
VFIIIVVIGLTFTVPFSVGSILLDRCFAVCGLDVGPITDTDVAVVVRRAPLVGGPSVGPLVGPLPQVT